MLSSSLTLFNHVGNHRQRYERVYAFGHLKEEADNVEFLKIHTFPFDRKKRPLEITGQHMVYLHNKRNPVRADKVKVGDILRGDHFTGLTVTKITKVARREQYAPLTPRNNPGGWHCSVFLYLTSAGR